VNCYHREATKQELLELLEGKTISYSEFKLEIEEQIQKYRRAMMDERQEAERLREEKRTSELETFRNNYPLNMDKIMKRYTEVLDLKERTRLNLNDFDTREDINEIASELETSPATYRLLLELAKTIEDLKESDQKLRRKIRRIKLTISGNSGYSSETCRCGYSSSGSYLGGRCHCGYGNESD
jgi:hypothetical protein